MLILQVSYVLYFARVFAFTKKKNEKNCHTNLQQTRNNLISTV